MPRDITVHLPGGATHVYKGVPDNITQAQMAARIAQDFPGQRMVPQQAAPKPLTRDQQLTAAGRDIGDRTNGVPNSAVSFAASVRRNLFGIPERLAAAGERFLPSSITGNTSNMSYGDILKVIRARTDAEMNRSATGNVLGAITGGLAGGRAAAGALSKGAGLAAEAASPALARVGNVLQSAMTMKKGAGVANAARVVAAGGAQGGAQAAGQGSDIGTGAVEGAAGAALLGGGFKAAQVVTRPFRDFLRLSSAGQILSRLTSATSAELSRRADAYRAATGAEPTLFELLPLADRNKIVKQGIVGRDNVVEQASTAIRNRAANLGPEMSARARAILQPNRDVIHQQLMDDLANARGAPAAGDAELAARAMESPTDMHEFRSMEARAIMQPHDDTHVADNFSELLPQHPQTVGKGKKATIQMVDSDPAVTAAIRSAAPAGFRAGTSGKNPAQPVTVADISSMIETLKGDLGKGGIEARTAQRAIDHLTSELGDRAPAAAAAHQRMTDAYAARSRMMEGMQEGSSTRLRNDVQVGTSNRQARIVRNAYDTPEGATGRDLGQGNRILSSLGGSPEEALRATVGISRNSTGRQLAQNVGDAEAAQISAAARAQDESAQALAAASSKAQGGADPANAETLVQAIVGLHPSSFVTTKAGAVRKLLDMTYIPENRARTIVDMIFSQNPDMVRRAINAVGDSPNGSRFLQYLGGLTGGTIAGGQDAGGADPNAPQPAPIPELPPIPDLPPEEAAPDASAAQPVDPASSPYAQNLQQIYQNENPELLDLIDKQFNQESGNRQFDEQGQPIESSAGAIGLAQVMPSTGPEAAALAGLPWDENSYRNDPVYNKLLGIAYMSEQLRKYGGDVQRALAAYNAGPGRVDVALARPGDWLSRLPAETQAYVARVAS